jgi:hypothetical protein
MGTDLETISETDLENLTSARVAEDQDIDFKQANYNKGPGGNYELSKDIASLANHLGGLILIGIRETDGQAEELTPIETDESIELRIRETVASWVFPMPQGVQVRQLESAQYPDRSYYLIAVPRSSEAPHGVVDKPGDPRRKMCWPIRNGTSTRYLHETELAIRYRDRFTILQRQVDRLEKVHELGASRREPGQIVNVTFDIALVPTSPGSRPLDGTESGSLASFLEVAHWSFQALALCGVGTQVTPRRRRIRVETGSSRFEFHSDGSAWARTFVGTPSSQPGAPIRLSLCEVEQKIHSLIGALGEFASWSGASGDALISIVTGPLIGGVVALFGENGTPINEIRGAIVPTVELTLPLDALGSRAGAGRAAYLLARDIEQDLGILAPVLLQPNGDVVHHLP